MENDPLNSLVHTKMGCASKGQGKILRGSIIYKFLVYMKIP